jgi:hypothetical protein
MTIQTRQNPLKATLGDFDDSNPSIDGFCALCSCDLEAARESRSRQKYELHPRLVPAAILIDGGCVEDVTRTAAGR